MSILEDIEEIDVNKYSERSKLYYEMNKEIEGVVKGFKKEIFALVEKTNKELEENYEKIHEETKDTPYHFQKMELDVTDYQLEGIEIMRGVFSHPDFYEEGITLKKHFDYIVPRDTMIQYCFTPEKWEDSDKTALEDGIEKYGIVGLPDIIAQNFPVHSLPFIKERVQELIGATGEDDLDEMFTIYCSNKGIDCVEELQEYDPSDHRIFSDGLKRGRIYHKRFLYSSVFSGSDRLKGFLTRPEDYLCDYYNTFDEDNYVLNGWVLMEPGEKKAICRDVSKMMENFTAETRWKRMKKVLKGRKEKVLQSRKAKKLEDSYFSEFHGAAGVKSSVQMEEKTFERPPKDYDPNDDMSDEEEEYDE